VFLIPPYALEDICVIIVTPCLIGDLHSIIERSHLDEEHLEHEHTPHRRRIEKEHLKRWLIYYLVNRVLGWGFGGGGAHPDPN
jgi:hypothetical protein